MPGQSRESKKDKQDGAEKDPGTSQAKSPSTKSKTESQRQNTPQKSVKGTESKNEPLSKLQNRENLQPSRNSSRPKTSESNKENGITPKSEARLSKVDNESAHKREGKQDEVLSTNGSKRSANIRSVRESSTRLSKNKYDEIHSATGDKGLASIHSTGNGSLRMSGADDLQEDTGSMVNTEASMFNYSDFDFRPYDFGKPVVDARAVLHSGPEPCSCYPRTSSRTVPSMMYDQVRCVHNGYVGCVHEGVCRFDDGWNVNHERDMRPRTQIPEEISYFNGYPQPQLDQVSESQRSSRVSEELKRLQSEDSGESQTGVEEKSDSQNGVALHSDNASVHSESVSQKASSKPGSGVSKPPSQEGAETSKHGSDGEKTVQPIPPMASATVTPSQSWNNKLPRTPDSRPTTKEINGLNLPEIGRSPATPKHPTFKVSTGDANAHSANSASMIKRKESKSSATLKPVTQFTPVNGESGSTRQTLVHSPSKSTPVQAVQKNRTFQGKYYDPVTDQVYSYEVTHEFGKHMNRWPYRRQECDS